MVRLSALLPLSLGTITGQPSPHSSRSVKQRVHRRSHVDSQISLLMDSVNWLGGCSNGLSTSESMAEPPTPFKSLASRLVAERAREERLFSETKQQAISALLKGKPSSYDEGGGCHVGGLATFDAGRISLPDSVHDCPLITDVLEGAALKSVKCFETEILNSAEEQLRVDAQTDEPRLYHDPVLAANPRVYSELIKSMHQKGMIRFTTTPRGHCTMFFVHKKGDRLRLIIDARQINRRCKSAPGVSLANPEVLASLESVPEQDYYVSTVDIKDCFHRLRLGEALSDLFCLPAGRASDFGVSEISGQYVSGDTLVYPACSCLPMGFGWSV